MRSPVAEPTQQPESVQSQIQRWLEQDQAPTVDVSMETSTEPVDDSEPSETPAESDDDYQPKPNAQTEGDETEAAGIKSFSDLAKRLEIDEETLAKHLTVQGRDGKEVSLHEALSAYRAPAPEAAALERDRARLQELEATREDYSRAAEELRQAAKSFAARLQAQEPNWELLKQQNPQEFLAKQFERMQHERELERAAQQYQVHAQQAQVEQQRKHAEFRRAEALKLQAAVPAWKDAKVFASDLEATEKFLLTLGFKAEELGNVSDHRDWLVADKARRWDELQAKKPDVLAKVSQLPRVIAPGASSGADRGAKAAAAKEEAALFERFKGSGKAEDAAELIARRMQASERRAAGRALASGRRT